MKHYFHVLQDDDLAFLDDIEYLMSGHVAAIFTSASSIVETRVIQSVEDLLLYEDMSSVGTSIRNDDRETMDLCPYFYCLGFGQGNHVPTNYSYQQFLRRIGAPQTITAKIEVVIVVGCMDFFGRQLASLPLEYLDPFISSESWIPVNYSSCHHCAELNKKCDHALPCSRCEKDMIHCVPNDEKQRVLMVYNAVNVGNCAHHDVARHTLHLQEGVYSTRTIDLRMDIVSIHRRLSVSSMRSYDIPKPEVECLPEELKEYLGSRIKTEAVRVEWLYKGVYNVSFNQIWSDRCLGIEDIMELFKESHVHPKLLDTLGSVHPTMAYDLFVESLAMMGTPVEWKGRAYWKDEKVVVNSVVGVISLILDPDNVISITTMKKDAES